MDPSMDQSHNGNSQDLEYVFDPNLLSEPQWPNSHVEFPPTSQYTQSPYSQYAQQYQHTPQYENSPYSTLSREQHPVSPYNNHSPYGNQFRSGQLGNNLVPQYAQNYLAPSNLHSTQESYASFSPQSINNVAIPTISPLDLHPNDANLRQGFPSDGPLPTQYTPLAPQTVRQSSHPQAWDHMVRESAQTQYPGVFNNVAYQNSRPATLPASNPSSYAASSASRLSNSNASTPAAAANLNPPKKSVFESFLRITNPQLLESAKGNPDRTHPKAPFIIIDETPIHLTLGPLKRNSVKKEKAVSVVKGSAQSKARVTKSASSPSKIRVPSSDKAKPIKSKTTVTGDTILVSASPSLVSDSDEDSGSYEDSSDDDMMEDQLENHREPTRPTDPTAAAGWDAIGIVWAPAYRQVSHAELVKAIPQFSTLIGGLRNEVKTINGDIKTADEEKRVGDARKLREARKIKRNSLQSALMKALEHGHLDILQNLGQDQKLAAALANTVIIDCPKMEDQGGGLPRTALKLLSTFTTLTDDLLAKVKFAHLEKRYKTSAGKSVDPAKATGDTANGKDAKSPVAEITEIQGYIAKIKANTVEAREKAKKAKSNGVTEPQKATTAVPNGSKAAKSDVGLNKPAPKAIKPEEVSKPALATNSLKRPHDGDGNDKPAKVQISDASGTLLAKKAVESKQRANVFSSLKRPGLKSQQAKVASTASVPAAIPPAPVAKKVETVSQSSSLFDILASIEKPKEKPKSVEAPTGAPETPEEKAKRERKESRRHLRVKFKEGDALEQIKTFEHDQEEDEGREEDMLRDAHDDRSEGMMLKQRLSHSAVDEDDDADDINDRPYPEPIPIDFSDLVKRDEKFTNRGGTVSISTPQQKIQEDREALEFMAIYTDPSEIPPSPKEPPNNSNDEARNLKMMGQPNAPWFAQRIQNIARLGQQNAISQEKSELKAKASPGHQASSSAPRNGMLKGSAEYNALVSSLETTIAPLKGLAFPPQAPPQWMTIESKKIWEEDAKRTYNDPAVKAKREFDLARVMSNLSAIAKANASKNERDRIGRQRADETKATTNPDITAASTVGQPSFAEQNATQQYLAELQEQIQSQGQGGNDVSLQAILAALTVQNAHPQPQEFASYGNHQTGQPQVFGQVQPNQVDPQILALLGGLNGATQAYPQTQPTQSYAPVQKPQAASTSEADNAAAWYAWAEQMKAYNAANQIGQHTNYTPQSHAQNNAYNYSAQQPNSNSWSAHPSRAHLIDESRRDNSSRGWDGTHDGGGHGNRDSGGSNSRNKPGDGTDRAGYASGPNLKKMDQRFLGDVRKGKQLCRFWLDGKCTKGDACGYLHEVGENGRPWPS